MSSETSAAIFVEKLLSIISDDLRGEGNRHAEEDQDSPKNVYPAGNLGSASDDVANMDDFRITEYVPSSVGLLFRIRPHSDGIVQFAGSFNIYHPRMPSLEELRKQAAKYEIGFPKDEAEWANPELVSPIANARIKFRPIYVRGRVNFEANLELATLAVDGQYHDISAYPDINASLASISNDIGGRSDCLRMRRGGGPPVELIGSQLGTQSEFEGALRRYDTKSAPSWSAGLSYRAWKDTGRDEIVVEVLLSNRISVDVSRDASSRGQDSHLFNPSLTLRTQSSEVVPFELMALKSKDYRVNSTVYSSGINCDVIERFDGSDLVIGTDNLPIYKQKRRDPARMEGYEFGAPSPKDLAEDPLLHLKNVSSYLHSFSDWWKTDAYHALTASGELPKGAEQDFVRAQSDFDAEVTRYDHGMNRLAADGNLLTAFRLMNRSFALNPTSPVKSWRIFQLVFIVISVSDLPSRFGNRTEMTSPIVLWYPTGGGKTEAYLGLAITCAFLGRLRGKLFGIAAWTKFPLRLLSIQQLGRIQAVVSYADLVRQESIEIPEQNKGDAFSVGLYAGGSNSSNDLDFPNDASRLTVLSFEGLELKSASSISRALLKNHKIDRCPMCVYRGFKTQGGVTTTFDGNRPGFRHVCDQCGYLLPLYVSDTETLRFLPTIVVSTIDKLAELGQDNANKILFGYANSKCPEHGYFLQKAAKCNVLGCGKNLINVEDATDPSPEVVIQDELHFLRETLGAFDSHYETMMIAIMNRAHAELGTRHGGPWNIVGSSATIEGFAQQIAELYCIPGAIRFPNPGPTKSTDAYSRESDENQRFVIGFRPQNMSHVDAVMKVLLSFHRATLRLANPTDSLWEEFGEPFASMHQSERSMLIRYYRTSLTYALLRTEAGQVHKSLVGQLNQILEREGAPVFEEHRIPNLTGESDATEVANVLHKLEKDSEEWLQAVTATSVIGHGVDLEVLNFMVFRGQPHTVSEWIQAMSRVGRKPGYPSIVVNVYNPNRERDAAYYTHHKKYIEHADTLIRTVPITRFSTEALRKTIRGLFYNVLAYYSEPTFRYYYRDAVKVELPKRLQLIRDTLKEYYGLSKPALSPKESRLLEALDAEIGTIEALLNNPNQPAETKKTINPMISLRDVDETVIIAPVYDADYFRWS